MSELLFVYGTLLPGEANAHVLAAARGVRRRGLGAADDAAARRHALDVSYATRAAATRPARFAGR